MDFFENAVGKAKDIFDVACKKTGEAVNTGKQRLDIATLENKMSKDFEKLGRIYFEQLKNTDAEGEIGYLKNAITQKQEQIDKIKAELGK